MQTEATTKPTPRKLTLKKELLRRLAPTELRLVTGGAPKYSVNYGCG